MLFKEFLDRLSTDEAFANEINAALAAANEADVATAPNAYKTLIPIAKQ